MEENARSKTLKVENTDYLKGLGISDSTDGVLHALKPHKLLGKLQNMIITL